MNSHTKSTPWRLLAVLVGFSAAVLALRQGLQPCDDAYITFRHAKNFALEGRLAWNLEGVPVMGSTSPAHVLTLGLLGAMFGAENIENIALALNAALLFAIVILVFHIAHDLLDRPEPALLAAILVGTSSVNQFVFSLGFEAAMLTAVILATLYAAHHRYFVLAIVLASVAPLIRPEGVALSPLIIGWLFLARQWKWRWLFAWTAVPVGWILFSLLYFGDVLPQPLRAKMKSSVVYRPYVDAEVNLIENFTALPTNLIDLVRDSAIGIVFSARYDGQSLTAVQTGAAIAGTIGLAILIARLVYRRDARLFYFGYPFLFIIMFAVIGRIEVWYWPSFVTTALLATFCGAITLVCSLLPTREPDWRHYAAWGAVFVTFAGSNNYNFAEALPTAVDPRGSYWHRIERERFEAYRDAALTLNTAEFSGAVLISEIGVFGYFYDGPVIDSVGLCTPRALDFYPPPRSEIFNDAGRYRSPANNFVPQSMIAVLEPDYVVNALPYIHHLLEKNSAFLRDYESIGELGLAWGDPVFIFRRRDTSAPYAANGSR